MNILFIGDIVGRTGRKAVKEFLPVLKNKYSIDFVVANVENAAGGFGLTSKVAEELFSYGIDCFTMGNHTWDNKDILNIIYDPRLIRPLNFNPSVPGQGFGIYKVKEYRLGVINFIGQVFMNGNNSPFYIFDNYYQEIKEETDFIIIDFHAEATGEKMAFAYYVDGKVNCVVGTHTHIQTADERILPGGTAYITDLGMTGAINSILGMSINIVVEKFINQIPGRYRVATGKYQLTGALIKINEKSGKTDDIIRIMETYDT